MTNPQQHLKPAAFERLREQMATAMALCADDQILALADDLHDALRRRRAARHARQERSWRPTGFREPSLA